MVYRNNTTIIIYIIMITTMCLQKDFTVNDFNDLTVSGPFRSDLFQGD
jgi:hypothetical protein